MQNKLEKLRKLIADIDGLISHIGDRENDYGEQLLKVHPYHTKSALNLVHYDIFRDTDLRPLQKRLRNIGMSRFANAGGHVEASLLNTRYILSKLIEDPVSEEEVPRLSLKQGRKLLKKRSRDLLGKPFSKRRVRIMVTQPTRAAEDYQMIYDMVKAGMDCARINCAHDNPVVWKKIIDNINKAATELNREVKIAMDLAGPKIRTGPIAPGPQIRKFTPIRTETGKIRSPAVVKFVEINSPLTEGNELPFEREWLNQIQIGDKVDFTDARAKKRTITVVAEIDGGFAGYLNETSYVSTGKMFRLRRAGTQPGWVGRLPFIEQYLLLRDGDVLLITRENIPGQVAKKDEHGITTSPAKISCQIPEIFDDVSVGDIVLFDDGKIEAVIEAKDSDQLTVRITRARIGGSKLRAEKGMNFPNSGLKISGLTEKDKADLEFVAKHADIVNFSFVNTREDVSSLLAELDRLGVEDKLGVILKIETKLAYKNLKDLLMEGMKIRKLGVMIARGDLAVETGWDVMGKVQAEILSLCLACHVPVVWATQVLENLAKKGLPSRSEITDATSSLKAECVMLNKGDYILEAIKLLDSILTDMERLVEKTEHMLPRLSKI